MPGCIYCGESPERARITGRLMAIYREGRQLYGGRKPTLRDLANYRAFQSALVKAATTDAP